ncbi:MAG: PilZ domain-containing protein [Candidatus Acidiferrum sp.]
MSARDRAWAGNNLPKQPDSTTKTARVPTFCEELGAVPQALTLKVVPLMRNSQLRRFVQVPTYAVGVYVEKRESPRASLRLPLKLRSVAGTMEEFPVTLVTRDISSSGVFFLCPKPLAMSTEIELDIVLVSRPLGYGNVVVSSKARVRRIEAANMPGWFGIAASFDDFAFGRDDMIPNSLPAY